MNSGTRGLLTRQWQRYEPRWRSHNFSGAAPTTQPTLSDGTLSGKWRRDESGLIAAEIGLTLGAGSGVGSAASFWALSLPFPASRSNGGADLPIGTGYCRQGATGGPLQLVVPTLADPSQQNIGGQGDEDNWVQGFANRLYAAGISGDANSPAFTSGVTSVTVTHNLGAISGFIPSIYDIALMATNSPSTNPRTLFADTITATTFKANVGVSSTTTPITYAWKIIAEPNSTGNSILVGPGTPWVWASGYSLNYGLLYEPRR